MGHLWFRKCFIACSLPSRHLKHSWLSVNSLIVRFMGPTWGPSGTDRTMVDSMLAPWTLLSGLSPDKWITKKQFEYFTKMHIKMASTKWQPFCSDFNALIWCHLRNKNDINPTDSIHPAFPAFCVVLIADTKRKCHCYTHIMYNHISDIGCLSMRKKIEQFTQLIETLWCIHQFIIWVIFGSGSDLLPVWGHVTTQIKTDLLSFEP